MRATTCTRLPRRWRGTLRELGAAVGISEKAARKRVDRDPGQFCQALLRPGAVTCTAAALTTDPLLWINDWDSNRQNIYQYKKPITFPAGSVVHSELRWDNSAAHPRNPDDPPRHVINGGGSADEMGGLWIGGGCNSSLELVGLLLANVGHYDEFTRNGRGFRKKQGTQLPEERAKP